MTSDASCTQDTTSDPLPTQRLLDCPPIPSLHKTVDPLLQQQTAPLSQQTEPLFVPPSTPAEPSLALAARATKIRRILLTLVLALGVGVIGLKALGSGSAKNGIGTSTPSPSASLLTEDLVRLLSNTPSATRVVGSYVPGVGVVISLSVNAVAADVISQWWSTTVEPIGARFAAELPNDRMVVLIQSAGSGGFARTIVLPTGSVTDVTSYRLATAISTDPAQASTNLDTPDRPAVNAVEANPNPASTSAADTAAPGPLGVIEPASTTAPLSPPTQNTSDLPSETAPNPRPSLSAARPVPEPITVPLAIAAPAGPGPASTTRTALDTDVVEGFEKASSKWTPMSGQWKFLDGSYQQIDNSGFDFISQYADILPTDFSVSIKLAAIEGDINGGLLLFQQKPGRRNEATIVDLTSSSTYLRWGHYDVGGVYVFDGGAKISALVDQATGVVLKIEVRGNTAVVFLNSARIGEFIPTMQGGTAGLISSQAKLKFDDFTIRRLQ
jgi:hypothetical protein